MGKLGIFMVISIFLFLAVQLVKMAYFTNDYITFAYSSLTAVWIFIQVTVNALVGLGVNFVPVTGVTLPLMSYGNSSLIITLTSLFLSLGLIYNQYKIIFTEDSDEKIKIIVSGGGTGGHYYPAVAVLKEIKKNYDAEILYFTTDGRIEEKN